MGTTINMLFWTNGENIQQVGGQMTEFKRAIKIYAARCHLLPSGDFVFYSYILKIGIRIVRPCLN